MKAIEHALMLIDQPLDYQREHARRVWNTLSFWSQVKFQFAREFAGIYLIILVIKSIKNNKNTATNKTGSEDK